MIGGNLEYLISSLPSLYFKNTNDIQKSVSTVLRKYAGSDEELPLDTILDIEAHKFLSEKDYKLFSLLNLENIYEDSFQKSGKHVLSDFAKYNHSIREIISQLRLSRINNKAATNQKENENFIIPGNPLEEEIQILKYQWNKLDELSIEHYSDFSALISYKLKLHILMRWWSFNTEVGFERFQEASKPAMGGHGNG